MGGLMEGWYVAKVKPQKETSLMSFLSLWDVEAFFPKVLSPGRNGWVLQPLFPTYLFCQLDPESSIWPVVRWAPGLAYFLNYDGPPASVPQELVDYLRKRVNQRNATGFSSQLVPGDKATVLAGPFAGLEGIFQEHIPSRQRCRILLEVVGRLARVELPEWDVQEVSSTRKAQRLGITPTG
jgi:transcriptional antiterminator RfaH